jgi:hypothetical protein
MLSCPRKTSREWQSVLARANGNEDEAMRIWVEEEFDLDPTLNSIPVSEENFEEKRKMETPWFRFWKLSNFCFRCSHYD